jgi:hypothetical protein
MDNSGTEYSKFLGTTELQLDVNSVIRIPALKTCDAHTSRPSICAVAIVQQKINKD